MTRAVLKPTERRKEERAGAREDEGREGGKDGQKGGGGVLCI